MYVPVGGYLVLAWAGILLGQFRGLCIRRGSAWGVPRHASIGDKVEVGLDHVILRKADGESGIKDISGTLDNYGLGC
jgi:hypothetical protein